MIAFIVCILSLARSAAAEATTEVDCTVAAPCQSLELLIGLQTTAGEPNTTLFAEADEICGGDSLMVMIPLVLACTAEVEVPVGCECATKETCAPAITNLDPQCLAVLVETLCRESYWLDEQLQVNLRGILTHLANDCAGLSLACPADIPEFDPEVCAATGPEATTATAPTAAPVVGNGTTTSQTGATPASADTATTDPDTPTDVVTGDPTSSADSLSIGAAALFFTAAAAIM